MTHGNSPDGGQPKLQSEKPGAHGLEELRAELTSSIQSCLDWLAVSRTTNPTDPVDVLTELTSRNLNLLMDRLSSLEMTLHAIREGKGRCTSCDGVIPLERLDAVGWPSCCVACEVNGGEVPPAQPDETQKTAGGGH